MVAFFGSLLAIGIFDILDPEKWVEYLGALIVAFITAGGVYAKQRLDDAKTDLRSERGQVEPFQLLIYAIVILILVVILFAVIDRV